jgi:hypothetical protein
MPGGVLGGVRNIARDLRAQLRVMNLEPHGTGWPAVAVTVYARDGRGEDFRHDGPIVEPAVAPRA